MHFYMLLIHTYMAVYKFIVWDFYANAPTYATLNISQNLRCLCKVA